MWVILLRRSSKSANGNKNGTKQKTTWQRFLIVSGNYRESWPFLSTLYTRRRKKINQASRRLSTLLTRLRIWRGKWNWMSIPRKISIWSNCGRRSKRSIRQLLKSIETWKDSGMKWWEILRGTSWRRKKFRMLWWICRKNSIRFWVSTSLQLLSSTNKNKKIKPWWQPLKNSKQNLTNSRMKIYSSGWMHNQAKLSQFQRKNHSTKKFKCSERSSMRNLLRPRKSWEK